MSQSQHKSPRHDDAPLPVDPGHVRTYHNYLLHHAKALLDELNTPAKEKAER